MPVFGVFTRLRSASARTGTGTGAGLVSVPEVAEPITAVLVTVVVPAGRVTGMLAETSTCRVITGALVCAAMPSRLQIDVLAGRGAGPAGCRCSCPG